jgi:AcrR family transcriptional regulator
MKPRKNAKVPENRDASRSGSLKSDPSMNKTALRILASGEALFKKFGIKRVTIDEICRSADLSKMTFYKYYRNKVALAKTILRRLVDAQLAAFRELMARDIPFSEKVRETIRMKLEAAHGFQDEWFKEIIEDPNSEFSEFVMRITAEASQAVREEYEKAQKNGDIRSDIRLDFIFYFMDHTYQMLKDERLVGLYDSYEALIAELMNFFFWGILPRDVK